jgi:hypothetical protein
MNASRPTSSTVIVVSIVAALVAALASPSASLAGKEKRAFTDDFQQADCTFATSGQNRYFVLTVGHQLHLQGEEQDGAVDLVITVLPDTMLVDGVLTRVIEEREQLDGQLVEVSRNYVAVCTQTGDMFYFGEDVDIYEGGVVVSHESAWHAGVDGAKAGILMPGRFLLGSRYFQELATGVALDRAEHTQSGLTVTVPAGTFTDSVEIIESSPLERGTSRKVYAPGIGLIVDGTVELVGFTP